MHHQGLGARWQAERVRRVSVGSVAGMGGVGRACVAGHCCHHVRLHAAQATDTVRLLIAGAPLLLLLRAGASAHLV